MTKQELYRDLCIEASTYDGITPADEWYDSCAINITQGMDEDFARAVEGDPLALVDARNSVGLPAI